MRHGLCPNPRHDRAPGSTACGYRLRSVVQVGWRGALLPFASEYRTIPVTLGVIALWAGLFTGLTARLAGSIAARVWWPVHKVSIVVLLLVWAHSVLAGTDVELLRWFYVTSGIAVLALAVTRYGARTPADELVELAR